MAKLSQKKKSNDILLLEKKGFFSFFSSLSAYAKNFFIDQKKFTRFVFILAVISIITTIYFFLKFSELKQNPTKEIDKQTKDIITKVSKLLVLPQDETPTIATVSDSEKLKNQPFFAEAKKGDKVLIYIKAQKAILYDPIENKIIEIAPIGAGAPPKQ